MCVFFVVCFRGVGAQCAWGCSVCVCVEGLFVLSVCVFFFWCCFFLCGGCVVECVVLFVCWDCVFCRVHVCVVVCGVCGLFIGEPQLLAFRVQKVVVCYQAYDVNQ